MKHARPLLISLPRFVSAGCLLVALGCNKNNDDIAAIKYLCASEPAVDPDTLVGADRCGATDDCTDQSQPWKCLPKEPFLDSTTGTVKWPADPPAECILKATRVTPPDGQVLDEPLNYVEAQVVLDTARINGALNMATCPMVKLMADGDNNAFLSGQIILTGKILWVDKGVTLFMSRNAALFQSTGNCGLLGVNDSSACIEFISVGGASPGIIGQGTIDGQGGEPLVGHDYSWWQMSYALRAIDGSIGNPTLINLKKGTTGFLLYRITLHNSAKFHVKLTSSPAGGINGTCNTLADRGKGFTVWGITLLTPSRWFNSAGYQLTPSWARNTDGVDPGTTDIAYCGVIACNTISTGDDHIAIKGGHWVQELTIAHNHFGTGHGMSIGSETYGTYQPMNDPVVHRGVTNVSVYDLTIDADSRPVGLDAHPGDFNGIRIKSDEIRGGLVDNIVYRDVCMRDQVNGLLVSTAYNPLFAGQSYPDFRNLEFHNVHSVTCGSLLPAVVTLEGYNRTLRPTITLDNVIFDNMNPLVGAAQEFAQFNLGPGDINFDVKDDPAHGVSIGLDMRTGTSTPQECHFPTLPAPQPPPGWHF